MIERLAEKATVWQIEKGIIDKSKRSVYIYGYIVLTEMITSLFLTFMVGALSGKMLLVISFSLMFIPLRSYCGGWHASKDWMCMLFSLGTLLIIVFFEQCSYMFGNWTLLVEVVSCIVIMAFAPIDTEKKQLDKKEKKEYGIIAKKILAVEILILAVAAYFQCRMLLLSIVYAHGLQGASLIMGRLKKAKR